VEDLLPRWRDELARAGYPVPELSRSVERAALAYEPPSPGVVDELAPQLLSGGGRLASEKTFTRADVVVAVAPYLHGLAVSYLDAAVDAVLSHELAIALPLVAGAREPVFAAACVLEDERCIAELASALAARPGPALSAEGADAALRETERAKGFRLSDRQAEVATALMTSGHSVDLVIGVAGAGKSTTLGAVRAGFEAAGYRVIGTATSGQVAKALEEGAGISSRTLASLTWRLEHGQEGLSPHHVLVVDEGAMSSDADMAKLLGAVHASGAKLVAVGDYRQLSSVGPVGALEALAGAHSSDCRRWFRLKADTVPAESGQARGRGVPAVVFGCQVAQAVGRGQPDRLGLSRCPAPRWPARAGVFASRSPSWRCGEPPGRCGRAPRRFFCTRKGNSWSGGMS
jgi:AAA domain